MTKYIAGLDIGGTSGRIKITGVNGHDYGEHYNVGCSINTSTREHSESIYRNLVLTALAKCSLEPRDCAAICIASSGVDSPELAEFCHNLFINMGFAESAIIIQNDCEIFLNLPETPSMTLIAGTGSICVGRTEDGTVVRSGGWNHVLSDEGSAHRIGLDVIQAVGNHLDGRETCPVLVQGFYEKTGIEGLYDLDCFTTEHLDNKRVIGSFALLAEQSLKAGEAAGIAIIRQNAVSLFNLVSATYRKMKLKEEEQFCLWLWGSVLLKCEPLREELENLLNEAYSNINIKVPPKTALEIAVDVARSHIKE